MQTKKYGGPGLKLAAIALECHLEGAGSFHCRLFPGGVHLPACAGVDVQVIVFVHYEGGKAQNGECCSDNAYCSHSATADSSSCSTTGSGNSVTDGDCAAYASTGTGAPTDWVPGGKGSNPATPAMPASVL